MYPEQRVGIFIDVQNIYHSAKNLYQARVNFEQLVKIVAGNRPVIRKIAYVVKSEGIVPHEHTDGRGEEMFFDALRKTGIELRLKDLQIYPGGAKKADWDVGLAVDAIRMGNSLDAIILITGDGDFVPLVEYLKWGLGKQVEVAAFSRTTSAKLKEVADVFSEIETMPKILLRMRDASPKGRDSRSKNKK